MALYHRIKDLSKVTIVIIIIVTAITYYVTSAQHHGQSSPRVSTDPSFKNPNVNKLPKRNVEIHYTQNKQISIEDTSDDPSDSSNNVLSKDANQRNMEQEHTTIEEVIPGKAIRFGKNVGVMKLAVVLCGNRLNQTLVTLKSAVALTKEPLHLIIMVDDENQKPLSEKLLDWPSKVLSRISFEIVPITFPAGKYAEDWKKLFKLCASQRLFFPDALPHIDSLLYVDTDVIFLRPVEDIWSYFSMMNSSQIAGLSPEHEDYSTGWYNRFARHPYYEPLGVNSGVMLMNLTRMREFRWQEYLQPIFQEYKLKIVWGDQDIINIIFHYHPDKLFIFSCEWNYRPDHCMYTSVCKTAEKNGVAFLHGNRGVFQNDKQPAFKAVYNIMDQYQLGTDMKENLLIPLKSALKETENTNCGKLHNILTKSLENIVLEGQSSESKQSFSEHNTRNEKLEF